jgi:hypothetical protein
MGLTTKPAEMTDSSLSMQEWCIRTGGSDPDQGGLEPMAFGAVRGFRASDRIL